MRRIDLATAISPGPDPKPRASHCVAPQQTGSRAPTSALATATHGESYVSLGQGLRLAPHFNLGGLCPYWSWLDQAVDHLGLVHLTDACCPCLGSWYNQEGWGLSQDHLAPKDNRQLSYSHL